LTNDIYTADLQGLSIYLSLFVVEEDLDLALTLFSCEIELSLSVLFLRWLIFLELKLLRHLFDVVSFTILLIFD
jgi:hypothetical protein